METEAKVTKLTEKDDIEAYLTTFEQLMEVYEVPQTRWSFNLAPQLIGRAQQAYPELTLDDAKNYTKLKTTILKRYGVNENDNGSDKPGESK